MLHLSFKPALMLILLLLVILQIIPFHITIIPQAHASQSFTLIGSIFTGWGFTKTSITSPGPDIIVAPGEMVTMTLASADPSTVGHDWGVDYNNNTFWDPGEPVFPANPMTFTSARNVTFSFTATTTPGNYLYYCFIHGPPMFGHFIVSAPDVAVTSLTTSRGFAYNGVTLANLLDVSVTAANPGLQTETFFVSAKANSTLIGNQSVTLAGGKSTIVTFQWNPSSLPRGVYIMTSQATKVPFETNITNNSFTGANFNIRFRGDINGDCKVDIVDLATVGSTFGKTRGQPGFNEAADLNNDGVINIVDLVIVAGAFGTSC
jgi:FtsP/CotA-like multicopper oxidase with cupredoxin domain